MKNSRTITVRILAGLLGAGLTLVPSLLWAQPSAHYVPGVEGIKGASLPPPGVYVRDYNVFYFANQVNDFSGNEIPGLDPEVFIYANVPRIIWITELKVLGGNLGVDALVPLQYTDIGLIDDSTFGVGDVFAEVTWSRHLQQFDFSLGYGVYAPTGNSDPTPLNTKPGLGYWTHMFTAGATWYPDKDKKWAVSALNRYEVNTEKDDTEGWRPGQVWTLEYGLSYGLRPTIDLGVVGYYQLRTTESTGADDREQVAAIGPEVSAFCTKLGLNTSLRYLYEFMAEGRLQGHTVALTLTKKF